MTFVKGSLYFNTPFHSYIVLNNIIGKIVDQSQLDGIDFKRFDLVECEVNTTDNTNDFEFYVQINFELKADENLLYLLKNKENDFKLYIIDKMKQYTNDIDFKYKYMDNLRFNEVQNETSNEIQNETSNENNESYKKICNEKRTIFILNNED